MESYNHLNVVCTRVLSTLLIIATATLMFAGMLSIASAALLDGDHFQDAGGSNISVASQVVRKGWGFMPGNGKFAIEDAPINYGITFDELPFLVVKFANSKQVADGDPADLSDCSITRNVIAAGVNQTTDGFKPILRTPTGLGFPPATNYCYTWIAIGRHDASYDGETDPVFSAWDKSTGITITESQISDLSHTSDADIALMGYIKSYSETDPVFSGWDKSSGITITESQISDLSHTSDADITAMGYIKTYSETDPQIGNNSQNYLPKWNGTELVSGTIYDDSSGYIGIGTNVPSADLHIVGRSGALFEGEYGNGQVPTEEIGTKMMWYPAKAAFRAGEVTEDYWIDDNIGEYSVAMGLNTAATGESSTAIGMNTFASGDYSIALGHNNEAQSYGSLVIGKYNEVSGSPTGWMEEDPIFVIGIGDSSVARANALTVLKNGKVGIRTSSPGTALEVNGVITASGGNSNEWNIAYGWGDHSAAGYLTSYTETDPEVGVNTTNFLPKWDGSALVSTDVYEDASGNIGINTATPVAKLHVNGELRANRIRTSTSTADYDKLRVYDNSNYTIGFHSGMSLGYLNDFAMTFTMSNDIDRGWVWRDSSDAQSDGAMSLTTDGRLYVKSTSSFNGNVGIKTTAPSVALHVNDQDSIGTDDPGPVIIGDQSGYHLTLGKYGLQARANATLESSALINTWGGSTYISDRGTTYTGYVSGDTYLSFGGGNTYLSYGGGNTYMVPNGGFVGIGTTTPLTDVFIRQSATAEDGTGGLTFDDDDTNMADRWKIYNSGDYLSFARYGFRRSYIDSDGDYIKDSDIRLKKNIENIDSVIGKIMELNAVKYNYISQSDSEQKTYGFVAQDIKGIFPELVTQSEDGKYGIAYAGFGVIAIKAIQEQQIVISEQHAAIKNLQDENEDLKLRVENMEKLFL